MNQDTYQTDDDNSELAPAWIGLLGAGMSGKPDMPLDDIAVAQTKSALMNRVRAASAPASSAPAEPDGSREPQIILSGAQWQVITPKIQVKVLRNDGIVMSWLLKLLPKTMLPAHAHADVDEECLVMQGSLRLNGTMLNVGDYTVARQGTEHYDIYSDDGCVVFLKSPASHQARLVLLCEA